MRKTFNTYLLLSLLTGFFSCTEKIETDYKGSSDNRLIVEGSITTDTMAHKVILSRTVDFNASRAAMETGALVTISDGEHVYTLSESADEPGIYKTNPDVYGVPGNEYLLEVTLENGETYSAISEMKQVSAIDSIRFELVDISFAGEHYIAYFSGQEPPEPGNRYMWNVYINDSLWNDTISETYFEEDTWVNGQYVSDLDIYWMDPEKVNFINDTAVVLMEMYSIPQDYYIYLIEVMSETTWRGSPWDPTPANVSTNISGGAVGFFYAAAITRKSVTYVKSSEE